MPFYAVIALFAIFTLFSCRGCGGGSCLSTISGKFVASYVKGLRVCVKGTNNCAFTNQNGEYSLSVNTSSVILEFFVRTQSSWLKLGESSYKPVITPFDLAGRNGGFTLAKVIHALNNDTNNSLSLIDLTNVVVTTNLSSSISDEISNNNTFSLNFTYNDVPMNLLFNATSGKVFVNGQEVGYRKWLILIYMNGDNDLQSILSQDLSELSSVTYPAWLKVVALTDNASGTGGVYESDEVTGSFRLVSVNSQEPNMGNYQTLKSFIQTYTLRYPAQYTALIMWNHGDGWRSPRTRMASFDSSQNDYLFTYELKKAIEESGVNLDLIGFDECFMAGIEVFSALANFTQVLVASELEEPGNGWDYSRVMAKLIQNQNAEPFEFGKYIVDAYEETYASSDTDYTMLAIKKEQVNTILSRLNALSQRYDSGLKSQFQSARNNSFEIPNTDGALIDLKDFASRLSLQEGQELEEAILNSTGVYLKTNLTGIGGISVYFPQNRLSDFSCYSSETPASCFGASDYYNPFAVVSSWDEMLDSYYSD